MIVVADTSPLNYLLQIDSIWLLPRLFEGILAPSAVIEELRHQDAPHRVRQWALALPGWFRVEDGFPQRREELDQLDKGERAALELAFSRKASLLLIDERKATAVAHGLGFQTVGTLGVLRDAHLGDGSTALITLTTCCG